MLTGKELLIATRPFAAESRGRSWWVVGSTLLATAAALIAAGLIHGWPLRLATSLIGALLLVRTFILFHDYQHGAILRQSTVAKLLMNAVGLLLLAPARSWRESHNYHHANVARLEGPAIGAFPVMTVRAWRQATAGQRLGYRLVRHPLTILFAAVTVFFLSITLTPLLRSPRKHWDPALSLLVHSGTIAALWIFGGPAVAVFAFIVPYVVASALGAYLFYAQHNFPGVRLLAPSEWTPYRAALESSSYLRSGPVMRWFSGNIGFHHVHHLNPAIPFYRLPEAMESLPELQVPVVTTLRPRDVVACFRQNIWDEQAGTMVTYRAATPRGHRGEPAGIQPTATVR